MVQPTPGIAQQPQPSSAYQALVQAWQAYPGAASLADSNRYADSALAAALTVLHEDSLNPVALGLGAKFLALRGDTTRVFRMLTVLNRVYPDAWSNVGIVGLQLTLAFIKRVGIPQRYAREPQALRTIFDIAAEAHDWPTVVSTGSALARADSSAAVDLPYFVTLWTAHERLRQPDRAAAVRTRLAARMPVQRQPWAWYVTQLRQGGTVPAAALTAMLRDLSERYPDDRVVLYSLFAWVVDQHDWEDVVALGPRVLAADSTAEDPVYSAAMLTAYMASHRLDRADAIVARAAARFPAAAAQYAEQLRHLRNDSTQAALATAREILRRSPKNPLILHTAFTLAVAAHDWGEVAALGPQVAAADDAPEDLGFWAAMLTAYAVQKQSERADTVAARVAARWPTAAAQYAGQLQQFQLRPEEWQAVQAVLRRHPESPFLLRTAFAAATSEHDWATVAAVGPAVAGVDPGIVDTTYYATLLTAYEELQQPESALALAAEAAARFPECATLWRRYATALSTAAAASHHDLPELIGPLMRQHAGDLRFGDRLFRGFAGMENWTGTVALWPFVANVDSIVGDSVYLRQLFTAYDVWQSPRALALAHDLVRQQAPPHDRTVRRAVFAAFGNAHDWTSAVAFGEELAAADTAAVDTAYFRRMFTAYSNLGQPRQTGELARTLLRTSPHSTRIAHGALWAFAAMEEWPHVVTLGRSLAAREPAVQGERLYGVLMATAYATLRRPRAAAAVLARTAARNSGDASLWLRYAEALRRAGRIGRAREAVYRAFELDRADHREHPAVTWLWYARELRQAGQCGAAWEAVELAGKLAPTDPGVRAEQSCLAARAPHPR